MSEVELSQPVTDLVASEREPGTDYLWARVLARLHGHPVGFVDVPLRDGRVRASQLTAAVRQQLGGPLARHLERDGLTPTELTERGLPGLADPHCRRPSSHGDPEPHVTVVVPTRERPELLRKCLHALGALDYPSFEVAVVDSSPRTDRTLKTVLELGDSRVLYLVASRPGVSAARNRALADTDGTLYAFTDDDVVVDRGWLRGLARGFTRAPEVGCTTGLVVTAELESEWQLLFDDRVRWGRSCEPRLFDLRDHAVNDPLYPYIAGIFGTGASFAVSREAIDRVGGFDEALGVGAPPRGGEDLDFFLRVVLEGMSIAYEPGAVAWHLHRLGEAALRRQLFGYGAGLTAYAFKHLLWNDRAAVRRNLAEGLRRLLAADASGAARPLPARLRAAELSGAAAGPAAYVVGRGLSRRERARRAAMRRRSAKGRLAARHRTAV